MRRTPSPAARPSWDRTPLLVVGVVVGVVVPLLSGTGSTWVAPLGFVGLVLLMTALVRRTRRSPHTSARTRTPERVAGPV
jgi:membrane protein implicated in regulation of membrane protease activity